MKDQLYLAVGVFAAFVIAIAVLPTLIGQLLRRDVGRWGRSRIRGAWAEAADRANLSYEKGFSSTNSGEMLRIEGIRRGRRIEAWIHKELHSRGTSKYGTNHTHHLHSVFRVGLAASLWQDGVKISPRDTMAKIEKSVIGDFANLENARDISLGTPKFDRDFIVAGRVSDDNKRMLARSEIQSAIREVSSQFDGFRIKLGELIVEVDRGIDNANEVLRTLDRCLDAADLLDDAVANKAREEQDVGDLFP